MEPEAIAGIYSENIVSSFDIYKPQKLNVLFNRYGDQGLSFFQTLRSMGFEKKVEGDTYGHYEDKRIHDSFKVRGATSAGAAGADVNVTVDQDSMDASNNFYPRKFDTVMFPNEVTAYIAAVDVTTPADPVLTLRPHVATESVPALSADDTLIIISNAFSEASGQPEGRIRGTYEYDNDLQIIKESLDMTGTEMTNQDWFNVTSKGDKIPAYYFLGQKDIDYRMALNVDGALLFQKRTDNPTAIDPDTGNVIKTTQGLTPWLRSLGNVYPKSVGAFDVPDLDAINNILDQEYVGNFTFATSGIGRHTEIENALVTYLQDTDIDYSRKVVNTAIFDSNEALAITVNFQVMTKAERKFIFKKFGNLNNPSTFGASGYGMKNFGYFMPLAQRKDPKNKNMVDTLGCRYKALGQYSRRMEVWSVGGAGIGRKVTEFDKRSQYLRTNIGFHGMGANMFVLVSP